MKSASPYKVLFVDDEPWVIIDILHSIPWRRLGFEVIGHYEKAQKAKEVILSEKPHLVFVDINMPVMNGFELIHQCRKEGSGVHFVILTAYPDFEFARKAIRESVLDYCLKPICPDELIKTLRKIKKLLNEKNSPVNSEQEPPGIPAEQNSYIPENEYRLNQIIGYIKTHYAEKILLRDLAEKFCFNKNYICYLFRKYTGDTFSQYILRIRVEQAQKTLVSTNLPLRVIAEEAGFSDSCYFNKVFKAVYGMPPHTYRLQKNQKFAPPRGSDD